MNEKNSISKFFIKKEEFPYTALALEDNKLTIIFDDLRKWLKNLEKGIGRDELAKFKKAIILAEIISNTLIIKDKDTSNTIIFNRRK